MKYIKNKSDIIKISKDNSNVPNNPYKRNNIDNLYNQREFLLKKRRHQIFLEFFQVTTKVNEAIDITDGGIIKSIISEMSIMRMKSLQEAITRKQKICGNIYQRTPEPFPI